MTDTQIGKLTLVLTLFAMLLPACTRREKPPLAKVKNVTETYFGVKVNDHYRYMENMDDTLFLDWMKDFASYSREILDDIPGRETLLRQLESIDTKRQDKIYSLQITDEGVYYYLKFRPEDEVAKLYSRDGYNGKEKLIFDPVSFSQKEKQEYVIHSIMPSNNGKIIAVNLEANGSEVLTTVLLKVEDMTLFDERIEEVFSGPTWIENEKGFLYNRINSVDVHDQERLQNIKIWFHRPGTPQSSDVTVFSSELYPEIEIKPEEIPIIQFDKDEGDYYLVLQTVERFLRAYHADPISFEPGIHLNWNELMGIQDEVQDFNVIGDDLYLYTARNASGFEILKTSKLHPDQENAEVLVPSPASGTISAFTFAKNELYYTVRVNGVEEQLYRLPDGSSVAEQITLPVKAGTVILSTRGPKFSDVWVEIYGWSLDGRRYRLDSESGEFKPEPLSTEAEFPEYDDLIVEELMVPSHDGTEVPLSVIYKKGTPLDGSAPLLMTGYGAYGIELKPYFSPYRMIWNLYGGILAISHVRGGGELGESWRLGGFKQSKPNTWKDFIACAEYLINEKYTSPEHLAIWGRSAGGILIGRSITERPDLFAAATSLVGIMNPLRAEWSPNGPSNAPEFGTVKDSSECLSLIEMDAYLKIEDGVNYPATLVTAGFNDPRVIVWQPAKFAARLQAANKSRNPVLLDVDYSSGHGGGNVKSKSFNDLADMYAFSLWQTGHPDFQK